MRHRPEPTKHGMHCTCGVFCGSGRSVEAWQSHVDDRVLLDGSAADINPSPTLEGWWCVSEAFRRVGSAYSDFARRLLQALTPPPNQDSFTKIDGGSGA